jgi:DnaJ homolog subfamily C member 9
MTFIPHSTHEDEARFIVLISNLISKRDLPALPAWESSIKDEKSRLVRKKQGEKEAKEAEQLATELGVWDEFYGSGKVGDRKSKSKGKAKKGGEEEDDTSALQALILKKKKNMDSFFDNLAAKYSEPEPNARAKNGRSKKRGKAEEEEQEVEASPTKRTKRPAPPDPEINDEEFTKLQQKLFGDKGKTGSEVSGSKGKKTGRTGKAR